MHWLVRAKSGLLFFFMKSALFVRIASIMCRRRTAQCAVHCVCSEKPSSSIYNKKGEENSNLMPCASLVQTNIASAQNKDSAAKAGRRVATLLRERSGRHKPLATQTTRSTPTRSNWPNVVHSLRCSQSFEPKRKASLVYIDFVCSYRTLQEKRRGGKRQKQRQEKLKLMRPPRCCLINRSLTNTRRAQKSLRKQ